MIEFHGMPQAEADALRADGPDAYGMPAERSVSSGAGNPCRCCLRNIPEGAPMLICAHKPFGQNQPYAETGPIFLCAETCHANGSGFPDVLKTSPDYLLKAYSKDERIIYGTGRVTPASEIESYAASLLAREDIAFVDARSARNNCWQVRITRSA
ncbi:DUF1203 domain-containing protein [Lentibacter sp. XHP0401]|uniref:DUF1203 domain-containing protein n=1 Tax=Lentibacter sp. XHP0401 TaxID=2984334 RepID=UPI0021E6F623|nr:DUF1203 domain-containing protein [Lentibacter sp. XHP0401]MCV2892676.1 DUF1203 domain-containing protein [Lentibacter sp. XHP0401]